MKGDSITVRIAAGGTIGTETIKASKAGRSVVQKTRATKSGSWLDVTELTRTGKPTGTRLSVRLDAVLSVSEVRGEVSATPGTKIKRVRITGASQGTPLTLDLGGG